MRLSEDAGAHADPRAPPAAAVLWLTGLSGAGKSTIAEWVVDRLRARDYRVEHLDGDAIRALFPEVGFDRASRESNVRRVGHLASRLAHHGIVVVASLISPYAASREFVRALCAHFIEVHVATPLHECERRDPHHVYARARSGELANVSGLDAPYECPSNPELRIDTSGRSVEDVGSAVLQRFLETVKA